MALSYIEPHRLGPAASHAAIAACVNEARRHRGDLAELFVGAAEAGHLVEPLDPVPEKRIQAALARVAERGLARAMSVDAPMPMLELAGPFGRGAPQGADGLPRGA